MRQNGGIGNIYQVMEWITKIVFINLLWGLFSLMGLIILGVFPATTAMYTVTKKWSQGITDIPIFKTFWKIYRREFVKSNLLFFPSILLVYVLYLDYQYLQLLDGIMFNVMLLLLINLSIIITIIGLYIFPVYVQFKYKPWQYYKNALIIGVSNPFITLMMLASVYLVYRLILFIPGLLPLVPVGLLGFIIMRLAYTAFQKLEKKQESLSTTAAK